MRRVGPAVLLALAACSEPRPGRGDLERMRVQPRYDVLARSRFFADGKAMQAPPDGTVPRERVLGPPLLVTGVERGTYAATSPIAETPALLAVGRARFGIYCAVCHGLAADGRSIVAENMDPPRPPSLLSARMRAMAPGYLFAIATNGVGRMPSYAGELSVRERWAVVAYLRGLQHAAAVDSTPTVPSPAGQGGGRR